MAKRNKGVYWLDRTLIEMPIIFCLATSDQTWKAACVALGQPDLSRPTTHASVTYFENGEDHACIVNISEHDDKTLLQVHALLVHEAVHIWQKIRKIFGERKPSSEFEAYSIQHISQELFYEYKYQTRNKRKKK